MSVNLACFHQLQKITSFEKYCIHTCMYPLFIWKAFKLKEFSVSANTIRAQELCQSRGGHPELTSQISLQFLWT